MKMLFFILCISLSHNIFAKDAKTFSMDTRVKQVRMIKKDKYQVEFFDYAAKYFADEKISKCLMKSIEERKAVLLKSTAYKNQIIECKIKN